MKFKYLFIENKYFLTIAYCSIRNKFSKVDGRLREKRLGMLDFPDENEPAPVCDSIQGEYRQAAVVSNTEYTSSVGRELLERGGSAVDALIGTTLCEGLCAMQNLGIGGGGFILVYTKADRRAVCLNARETAPRLANKNMFKGDYLNSATGSLSIAVPGELMGYWEAHQRFGRLPWSELFRPAICMCLEGVPINRRLGKALSEAGLRREIMCSPSLRKVLGMDDRPDLAIGDKLRLPALARTLEVVAGSSRGALELYDGSLTADFLKDLEALGSIITSEDLRQYRAVWMEPEVCELPGNLKLYSVPPPASGAILVFILRLLEGLIGSDPRQNVLLIAEAFKYAYAARTHLGDPLHSEVTNIVGKLKTEEYINEIRTKMRTRRKTNLNPSYYGARYGLSRDDGTGNISVLAPNGDVAVATSTINTMFGSMLASESTGIILNNQMDDFSSPDIVNSFGLPPCPNNSVCPGKRPLSSACPTVVVDEKGEVRLALGAAGGSHITTSTAQVIINNLWFNLSIKKAVDLPRIHHQLMPMKLCYENRIGTELVKIAEEAGHKVKLERPSSSLTAIARNKGVINAIYDYRRGGSTAGY